MDVTLQDKDYIIAHGGSKWIKPEKVSSMKRKGETGRLKCLAQSVCFHDLSWHCALMSPSLQLLDCFSTLSFFQLTGIKHLTFH